MVNKKNKEKKMRKWQSLMTMTAFILILSLAGCSTYSHRVAPIDLPSESNGAVNVEGVRITAKAYLDQSVAKKRFGFDIRGAGILPVQVVIDNQSGRSVMVDPTQTFLIDQEGKAWPLLSLQEAYKRTESHVQIGETAKGTAKPAVLLGAAGALVGLAVGIVSGRDIGENVAKGAAIGATAGALSGGAAGYQSATEKVRRDLSQRSLRNKAISPGHLAHGFLLFPGKDEAKSISRLRLSLKIGDHERVVELPVQVVTQ